MILYSGDTKPVNQNLNRANVDKMLMNGESHLCFFIQGRAK